MSEKQMHYDVFNGDADGIIALLQLRLADPRQSKLITGVKRDIKLLEQVVKAGDAASATVLDLSMEKNMAALEQLLETGAHVFYCDHHRSGDLPESDALTALINLDAEICTSLLISQHLEGQYASWAVAAAFGDNLFSSAEQLAANIGLSTEETAFLKELGTLINYNGYGASVKDLHIPPAELFSQLLSYPDPMQLKADRRSPYYQLKHGYDIDSANVASLLPIAENEAIRVYELPCEPWARRISGVFGNQLANESQTKAHAVLTLNQSGTDFTVSVRAPLANREGADVICSQFATGGGRKAAAGVNQLPLNEKQKFISVLNEYYQS